MEPEVLIRQETESEYGAVENLVRESFWNVYRPGCMEHYLLHCFRKDPARIPELDLVMERGGELIGQILYVRAEIRCDDGQILLIALFGPVCIAPKYQRKGYGKKLVEASLARAAELGIGAVAITGNLDFYGKCGFALGKDLGVRYAEDPEADYFLVKELKPGFLRDVSGTFRDPEGYGVCEKEPEAFEAYEAAFPKKEKLRLPGQLF